MKNLKKIVLLSVIAVFAFAKPVEAQKSTDKVTISGISYYLHKVKRKESLYGISKLYNVDEKTIRKANPKLKKRLKKGKTLKIPIFEEGYIYHSVMKGETLYSIAKYYGTKDSVLIANNPDAVNGIRIGELLKIPEAAEEEEVTFEEENTENPGDLNSVIKRVENPCAEFEYDGQSFKVALMLPLYLQENENLRVIGENELERIKYFYNSRIFIDYYEGTLMALDSLRKQGVSVDLHVYDTENKASKVREIAQKEEIADMDLIIGPVYSKNIKILSEKLSDKNINIVSPLDSKDTLVKNIPNLFHVNASYCMRFRETSEYIKRFENPNIIIVYHDMDKEKKYIEIIENELLQKFDTLKAIKKIYVKQNSEIYKLQSNLDRKNDNLIIVTTDNEVVVSNFMSKVTPLGEKFPIAVFGSKKWESFSNMDFEYYSLLDIVYHSGTFADDFSENLLKFKNTYCRIYNHDASEYSIQGFDVTYYFINLLKQYGKNFNLCFKADDEIVKGIHTYFDFEKLPENGGFENQNVFLMKYNEDYYFERLDTLPEVIDIELKKINR